jgi:hypothetical protein
MLYLGFAFLLLAIAGFVLGFATGMPGLGPLTNAALLVAIALLAGGLATRHWRHDHGSRHA